MTLVAPPSPLDGFGYVILFFWSPVNRVPLFPLVLLWLTLCGFFSTPGARKTTRGFIIYFGMLKKIILYSFWRHGYSGDLNIVICVDFSTLPFYAINMDVVSLFTYSSFLFLVNFHCIDVLYQFEWMNVVYFCQKKVNPIKIENILLQ